MTYFCHKIQYMVECITSYIADKLQYVLFFLTSMSLAISLLILSIVVILSQNRKLKRKSLLILEQSLRLDETNKKLFESIEIKDVILQHFIMQGAAHEKSLQKLYDEILRKLKIADYAGIQKHVKELAKNRVVDFAEIDRIILQLFPDFVEEFNGLLQPESRFSVKEESLAPEMRIFGLIKLGITKNTDLAMSLDYSVNTIKTYKTKVLNASLYPKETFYQKLCDKGNLSMSRGGFEEDN